jgi:hypothetical protein
VENRNRGQACDFAIQASHPHPTSPKGRGDVRKPDTSRSLGESIKDDESIAAANENGIAMAFTGIRDFKD